MKVQKADVDARRLYRRTVDDAYSPVQEAVKVLADHKAYLALEEKIRSVEGMLTAKPPREAAEDVQEVIRAIRDVEGAREIASAVNADANAKLLVQASEGVAGTVNEALAEKYLDGGIGPETITGAAAADSSIAR